LGDVGGAVAVSDKGETALVLRLCCPWKYIFSFEAPGNFDEGDEVADVAVADVATADAAVAEAAACSSRKEPSVDEDHFDFNPCLLSSKSSSCSDV
jgi:hypothetical protein